MVSASEAKESAKTSLAKAVKAGESASEFPLAFVAGLAYFLMLLFIWGPFVQTIGLPWETGLAVASESTQSWRNFLYAPDPMRIHNANFYELAYRLGEWTGIRGSFVPYQIVYGVLWWARSFLSFLLIRRLMPKPVILPFIAGAIMLIHGADMHAGWPGDMHQLGQFLWLLICLYLLVDALEATTARATILYLLGAWVFQYWCLWTYEAPLFIILAAPIAFAFLLRRRLNRSGIAVIACWYLPALVYVYKSYVLYMHRGGNPYQVGVMRKSFSVASVLSDWVLNVRYSLSFWSWQKITGYMAPAETLWLAAGVVVVFLAATFMICRYQDNQWEGVRTGRLGRLLAVAFLFLVLSFPAFLFLAAAREPVRTQLLAAISASIVLGGVAVFIAMAVPLKGLRSLTATLLVVPVVWVGACRVVERQASVRAAWDMNLMAMRDLIREVGRVKDGTVVVMTNVPKDRNPFFAYNFWFNNALRLAYPRTNVGGVYYFEGGEAEPTDNLALSDNHWDYTGQGVAPLIRSAGIDQTLVLEFQRNGPPKVLSQIPSFICSKGCSPDQYHPETRILPGPPAPEAVRRYGPL